MNKVLKELATTAIYMLVVLGFTWLIINYVGQRTVVDGSSMEYTLSDGDNLWVDKLGYRFGDPERFDIVVFPYPLDESTYLIKRIIGLPGESVHIDEEGKIYINGDLITENYGKDKIDVDHIGRAAGDVVLGTNEYFVMGDNRNNSLDSRFDGVGNVKRDKIIGKAVYRILPFKSFGGLK